MSSPSMKQLDQTHTHTHTHTEATHRFSWVATASRSLTMVRAGSPPPPPPPPPPDGALLLPPPPSFFLPNQFIDNAALFVLSLLDVAESVEDTLPTPTKF